MTPLVPILLGVAAIAIAAWLVRLAGDWRTARADAVLERVLAAGAGAEADTLRAAWSALAARAAGRPLATLRWRLVTGAAGVGKSEWLARSGQEWLAPGPAGRGQPVPGAGATRGMRWWFAADGVTIECGPRAASSPAWQAWCAELARVRGGRAFDDVVCVTDAGALARVDAVAVAETAAPLAAVVAATAPASGAWPALHVLVAGMDRLAGFSDFFSEPAEVRGEGAWGVRLDREPADPGTRLSALWIAFVAGVRARRLERAAAAPDDPARGRAFIFPAQLEVLRPGLDAWISALALPAGAPIASLAGCSAHAVGEVTDHVRPQFAHALGLKPHRLTPPAGVGGTWFARGAWRLFQGA